MTARNQPKPASDRQTPGLWRHYRLMVEQGLNAELADAERLLSPLLFALTMLLPVLFAPH